MVKIDKQMTFYAFFPSTFGNRGPSPITMAHKKKIGFGQVNHPRNIFNGPIDINVASTIIVVRLHTCVIQS